MGTFSIVAYILAQLFQKEPDTMMQAFFARGFSIAGKSGGGGGGSSGGAPAQLAHLTANNIVKSNFTAAERCAAFTAQKMDNQR